MAIPSPAVMRVYPRRPHQFDNVAVHKGGNSDNDRVALAVEYRRGKENSGFPDVRESSGKPPPIASEAKKSIV